MDLSNLEKVLEKEPKYRFKQANEAVFKNFISDWSEATFFTKNLRERLNKECPLEIKADVLVSKKEDSVKARITLKDGLMVEAVLMRHKDGRNTVCVSSQVGCPLGCLFCATGKMGFKRNLTSSEIIEQVIFFSQYLKKITLSEAEGSALHVTNVTYMGMGEPFLNYENVLKSIRILNDKEFFNIGARSISVSTSGIIEGIKKFSGEGLQVHPHTKQDGGAELGTYWNNPRSSVGVNLAISLHAPNDKLRKYLMPIDKKYPLEAVLKAVDDYIKITKRKVMFEYVLINGVNDTVECAKQLAKLMEKKLYFLNLILYNATGVFKPSKTKNIEKFKSVLKKNKINFVQRYRFGDDIQAACGQFTTSK